MAVLQCLLLVLVGLSSCAAEDDKILISFSPSSVTIEDGSSRNIYMTVINKLPKSDLLLNLTLQSPLLHINCNSSCSDVLVKSPGSATITEVVVMVDPIEEGSPIQIYPPRSFEVEIYSGG